MSNDAMVQVSKLDCRMHAEFNRFVNHVFFAIHIFQIYLGNEKTIGASDDGIVHFFGVQRVRLTLCF
jgi:hypothetical protein